MMEMMTSTSPDAVLPGSVMLLSTNPAAAHSVLLSQRSAAAKENRAASCGAEARPEGLCRGSRDTDCKAAKKQSSK